MRRVTQPAALRALPIEILLWYRNLGLDLFEGYGLTETLITHLPAPGHVRPGYVGCAIDGVEVKLGRERRTAG